MEAPLHSSPVPMPAPAPPRQQQQQDALAAALLQQAAAVNTVTMAQQNAPPATAMSREQCPRCASPDTKFCYYNNYNTAQPRHFCRACRRYWTLGGSLRNVPVGGSTRKRPRPARPTRALAAAVAASSSAAAAATTANAASSSCSPFATFSCPVAAPAPAAAPALSDGLLSSLLLLGLAPLLEGRLGFDPDVGQPDALAHQLGFGAGPLLWPTPTASQGDRAEPTPWKSGAGMFPPPHAALLREELTVAAPMDHTGGRLLLHQLHGAPPPLPTLGVPSGQSRGSRGVAPVGPGSSRGTRVVL